MSMITMFSYCLTTQKTSGHLCNFITECVTDISKHFVYMAIFLLPTYSVYSHYSWIDVSLLSQLIRKKTPIQL